MALGDGTTWDETTPTDATLAIQIDDYNRDLRKGIRSRLALEHEFPTSQAATAEAGRHKYLTFQRYTADPMTITGTQIGGLYVKSVGTTGDSLIYVTEDTLGVNLSRKAYFWYIAGAVETGTNVSATLYLVGDGKIRVARAYAGTAPTGAVVQVDINYNGSSIWTATSSQVILAAGSTSTSVASFVTTAVTAGGTFTIDVDKIGATNAGENVTVMVEVG